MGLGDHVRDLLCIGQVQGQLKYAVAIALYRVVQRAALRAVEATLSPRASAAAALMRPNPRATPVMNQIFRAMSITSLLRKGLRASQRV